jgi:LytS/YehU family sensor histidine kinase
MIYERLIMNSSKTYILLLLSISFQLTSIAQNKVDIDFNFQVDKILVEKPNSYSELEEAFKDDTIDTLKMQFLAQKSKEINYLEGESFARCNLGILYRNISRYNSAIASHQNAYNLALSAKNIELQVVNLNMLGVVNRRIDNNQKAIEYHQEALKIAESQEEQTESLKKSIAVSYNSIGNIYLALDNPDNAIENFNKSLSIEEALGNKIGLAINYHNIGFAFEENGEIDAALDYYFRSLDYNNEINSLEGKVICNNSIAQVYLKRGNTEEALNILKENLSLAIENKDLYYITSTYIGLGWAQYDLNQFKESESNLNTALEIAEERKMPSFIATANIHLSELYKRKGDYKLAFEKYLISDKINHEISSDKNKQYVTMLDKKYKTEKLNNALKQLEQENKLNEQKRKEYSRNQLVAIFGLFLVASILFVINRQRRLKNEKKIITLEQDMLRSQMNPHFIFNSLNSIKLYIINNEKENAVYYLNKFSKLIRKILLASKEKEITLAEELETMDLYMNIENIRFSNEINYNKNISPDVDLEAIKVPSLILQPFLENALWHGLSSKSENKSIDLEISNHNGSFIIISITDNGIGRVEAQKIKRNKLLKRKSLGLAITNERLANFYKDYNKEYSIEIKDLYDENNKAAGTKVIITVPIKKAVKLKTA